MSCICKTGYTGPLCDKCMLGYYGNTEGLNGKCSECDCDPDGIVSNECDEITGQCNCRPGMGKPKEFDSEVTNLLSQFYISNN